MDDSVVMPGLFGNANLLLVLGVGLAVVLVGLLAFDFIRRRRRARRRRPREVAALREKLLTPFHRWRAFRTELEQVLRDHPRRRRRSRRRPPEANR